MPETKGMSLEREFAQWMTSHLGYTSTRLRIPVKGKVADRAYEVDIYGEKYVLMWEVARRLGIAGLILSLLIFFLPLQMREVHQFLEILVANFVPQLSGAALLILSIGSIVIGIRGKERAITYAWVECKDTRTNVKRAQVQKLAASVEDVEDNGDAKWKPDVVMLVSGSDFDADALNFCREHDFVCYRRSNKGFEIVELE
jgi:hypothetical protein